jgi:hypothetical protein
MQHTLAAGYISTRHEGYIAACMWQDTYAQAMTCLQHAASGHNSSTLIQQLHVCYAATPRCRLQLNIAACTSHHRHGCQQPHTKSLQPHAIPTDYHTHRRCNNCGECNNNNMPPTTKI